MLKRRELKYVERVPSSLLGTLLLGTLLLGTLLLGTLLLGTLLLGTLLLGTLLVGTLLLHHELSLRDYMQADCLFNNYANNLKKTSMTIEKPVFAIAVTKQKNGNAPKALPFLSGLISFRLQTTV